MDHLELQDKFELLGVQVLEVLPAYALTPQLKQDLGEFHDQTAYADPRFHERGQIIPRRVSSESRALILRRDRAHVKRDPGSAILVIMKGELIRGGDYHLKAKTKGPLRAHLVKAIMRGLPVIRGQV